MIIDVDMHEALKWTGKALKIHDARIDYNTHMLQQTIRIETSYDAIGCSPERHERGY